MDSPCGRPGGDDRVRRERIPRSTIVQRFGDDTTYRTCSADGMDVDQLIDFLAARGKFGEGDEGALEADPTKMCSHNDKH